MKISEIVASKTNSSNNNKQTEQKAEAQKTDTEVKQDSKNGVEEYGKNHSEAGSCFDFYKSDEANFNLEEYKKSLRYTSAEILKRYDKDGDGQVASNEFTNGLAGDFSLDIIEYNAKDDGAPEDAEEAVLGAYRASDMISKIVANLDMYSEGDTSTISVEELSTLLEYVDVYGYHDVEGSTFMAKDDNGHGKISREALLSLYDYLTDGGTQNVEAGKKYRNGKDLTDEEIGELKNVMVNGIATMMQEAAFFDIDLSQNSKYTDFE